MNARVEEAVLHLDASIDASIDAACRRIAPTWPLDRFIAVNPWWGLIDRPMPQAAAELSRLAGASVWMPKAYYRSAWLRRLFGPEHLARAARESDIAMSVDALLAELDRPDASESELPLLSDVVDMHRDLRREPSWRSAITHQVSQFCAAYFDADQSDWRPVSGSRLFVAWRDGLASDPGIGMLMDEPQVARRAAALPEDPREAIRGVLATLGVPVHRAAEVLAATLLRIGGWAAWCAYLRWQARLRHADDQTIVDLLAVRLAWEGLLDDGRRDPGATWERWQRALHDAPRVADPPAFVHLGIFQRAMEIAYQASLARGLESPPTAGDDRATPPVQAVFCIDVRSEVFRRALETVAPGVQTLGFAGFYGIPASFTPLGTHAERPQLPGLLAPNVAIVETAAGEAQTRALGAKRRGRLRFLGRLRAFGRMPASAFGFVESAGLGYAAKLIGRSLFMRPAASPDRWGLRGAEYGQVRPRLAIPGADTIESRAALAEKILRAMSFGGRFARLVLLVGHGSSSANNAHAASLDCGACCGQTGAANARALAALLNEPAVRSALARRGIVVPQTTRFLAALHDTTTDDVELFDADDATPTHAEDLDRVRIALRAAGQRARAERAPALGLAHLVEQPGALYRAVRRRAGNWAETRPEWGLAGNAAFIAAPRGRTRGVDLGGRVFLHEYDWRLDADGSVLELIMTAPMVVAHWINMQYNASVTDNARYGSGNKLLHNVVGGRIGVFEGNGGDLRIGLPLQSVHDGKEWRHTPQRLSVYIEAPRGRVEAVVAKHPVVRQLVGNRWIFLFAIDPASGRIDPVHAPVHRADAEEAAGSRAIG